jgi:hypothetical protein
MNQTKTRIPGTPKIQANKYFMTPISPAFAKSNFASTARVRLKRCVMKGLDVTLWQGIELFSTPVGQEQGRNCPILGQR